MYKIFFLAKNNIKRQKGDMITFLILTFLSAFLIFDCLCALTQMQGVLDETFRKVNGPHIYLNVIDNEKATQAADRALRENAYIKDYEHTPIARLNAEFGNPKDGDYITYDFLIYDQEEECRILNVVQPDVEFAKDDVFLPLNLKGSFPVGDTFELRVDDRSFRFRVAGYTEDPYYCSTLNMTIHSIYISGEMIREMYDAKIGLTAHQCFKGVVDMEKMKTEGSRLDRIESEVGDIYKAACEAWEQEHTVDGVRQNMRASYMLLNWDAIRNGDAFLPKIVMALVLMFAILVLLIALIIISFSIRNFIRRNMNHTGILEAGGYTVRQLKLSLVLQITLVAAIGAVLGLSVALFTFSGFGNVLSSVLGLSWNQPVNIRIALETGIALTALVAFVTWIIGRQYNKISVLDALRGGISTHNYKRNYFSFETTNLPVPVILSLKETVGGLGKNILMFLMMGLLAMFALVGFGLYQNFGKAPDKMIKLLGIEVGTMVVTGSNDIADDLRALPETESVIAYYRVDYNFLFNGDTRMYNVVIMDDPKQSNHTTILEGRLPERDNEVMVTSGIVDDLGVKVGDVIEIENVGKKEEFLVVGVNQKMEHYGRTAIMTMEAARRITNGKGNYTYTVTAEDGVKYDELKSAVEVIAKEKGLTLEYTNSKKEIEGTIDTLSMAMEAFCIIICFVTALVVTFVESLVIRAKISKEWRGMGISKALGETSRGLMVQIMMTNLPAILLGVILGGLIVSPVGNLGCRVIFSGFGIRSVSFSVSLLSKILTGIGILAVAILTSLIISRKVKKLKPVEMITEE